MIYTFFCWSHPIYVFLEKSFGTKAFKFKTRKEIKKIEFKLRQMEIKVNVRKIKTRLRALKER